MTELEKRRSFCEQEVTLNGHPARISGAAMRFAQVTDKRTGLSCEWSWEAVERIIANGGAFKT